MIHFTEINQAPPLYSMLQDTERVATRKLAPENCLRNNIYNLWRGVGFRIYVRYCKSF